MSAKRQYGVEVCYTKRMPDGSLYASDTWTVWTYAGSQEDACSSVVGSMWTMRKTKVDIKGVVQVGGSDAAKARAPYKKTRRQQFADSFVAFTDKYVQPVAMVLAIVAPGATVVAAYFVLLYGR